MIILLDTNVILDILLNRQPFCSNSKLCLTKLIEYGDKMLISSTQVTDIYYILSKGLKNRIQAREAIKRISTFIEFSTIDDKCIRSALISNILDFEDAVVAETAEISNATFILTRNTRDFVNSTVRAINPEDFLKLLQQG